MILSGRFNDGLITYMVPGHTKFNPDSLFSQMTNRIYKRDLFDTSEVIEIVKTCDETGHKISP